MTRPLAGALLVFQLILLSGALSVNGQDNYTVYHYSNENGLPVNGVKGIELDKENGLLWVGTQGGLVQFDGKQFRPVISGAGATASRILIMARNREGAIFCEDDNFSVYRIQRNRVLYETVDSFFAPLYRGGFYPVRPAVVVSERLRQLKRSSFLPPRMLFQDNDASKSNFFFIYLDTAYYYNAQKDTLLNFPGFDGLLKAGGTIYLVRSNLHLWRYSDSLQRLQPVSVRGMPASDEKANEKSRFIWTPGMQEPLLIHGQDLWRLEGDVGSLHLAPLCGNCCPANSRISSVQVWDEKGMLFLGSQTDGLYVLRRPFLHTVRPDSASGAEKVQYAQAEVTPGTVATPTGLVFSTAGKKLSTMPAVPLPRDLHSNIYQDEQKDCWYYSGDTILHYYRRDGRLVKIAVNDGAEKMVFTEARGHIYVVSNIAIADITDDRYRLLYALKGSSGTLKNSINPDAAIEWQPGILAIAAEKLILFNTAGGTRPDTLAIPGLTVKIRALLKYRDYLFIGTYGQGFYLYRNGVIKKMPLDKNGYLSFAHCFLPDDSGYCWISTNHGLFKASLHALTAAYDNNLKEIYYQYFGKEDGISNAEFNGGCQPCALRLTSGLFSFPTMNGMVLFDPRQPHMPPPAGRLFIDAVETDSVSHDITDSRLHSLPCDMRNIRFKLSLAEFGDPENIYFSYKLEPYNNGWETQDIVQNNTLQFGGLTPGAYKLYLRVRKGFEPDDFAMTEVDFRILEPWYRRWWAYLLGCFLFLSVLWLLVKWRTATISRRRKALHRLVNAQTRDIKAQSRQLERQLRQLQNQQARLEENNKIKARLIGIISHDMISPLKFVAFMGKKLRDGPASTPTAHQTANFIVTVAQELESLSLNMLNWIRFHYGSLEIKPEPFDLHQLIVESTEIPSTLAREKGLGFYNEVPARVQLVQYRQALGVIIYNLTMNAMKYTAAGEIHIAARLDHGQVSLSVTDTGAGMDPMTVKRLNQAASIVSGENVPGTKTQFGYIIIKDLLRLTTGSITVESDLKNGTRVTVFFPLHIS
jgi:signal transduction histidine kinase